MEANTERAERVAPADVEVRTRGSVRRPLEDVSIDDLLLAVVEYNASDLHLAVGLPPTIRVDGELRTLRYVVFTPEIMHRMLYQILSEEHVKRFERQLELDLSYQLPNVARFRVNVFHDRGAMAAAFRLIPQEIPTVTGLGLPSVLSDLARRPRGLLLLTGPTGCGKSTTLAAMIGQINQERSEHVITVEDPIEYMHSPFKCIINQRELGLDTHSFANALRSALREDPDVLLVGEMRDLETIKLALTCAETGHLVLSTLHTNNSAEAVDRIIDVFPGHEQEQIRVQLSNNLLAIIAQQLLGRADQPGRVPAVEVMIATPAVRNLIRENKTYQLASVIQTGASEGMVSMDQSLAQLYREGRITYETALRRSQRPGELEKMVASQAPMAAKGMKKAQ